jgi:hypothetical protein
MLKIVQLKVFLFRFFWKTQKLTIINKIKEPHDENMIKYIFHDPCQEKCKVAINQVLTY